MILKRGWGGDTAERDISKCKGPEVRMTFVKCTEEKSRVPEA
jgi:hypothetical protein